MGKRLTLLFIFLISLATFAGYIVLTEKVTAGREKIAAGQKQLEEGQKLLAQGKVKLATGKQKLSGAKNVYNGVNTIAFLGLASKLPIGSEIFDLAKTQINDGGSLVARGSAKIKAGEEQLAAGQQDLDRGMKRLTHANVIRLTCAGGAAFFAMLGVVLGICWRRTLFCRKR
jgi:uncharacterized phage infection (PIP) family protein YhgE